MAKKGPRQIIKMRSTESTHMYLTTKNRRNDSGRIELRKFDPIVRRHVVYRESKWAHSFDKWCGRRRELSLRLFFFTQNGNYGGYSPGNVMAGALNFKNFFLNAAKLSTGAPIGANLAWLNTINLNRAVDCWIHVIKFS